MKPAALPVLFLLALPSPAGAQPGGPPPPEEPEVDQGLCHRGACGPERPRRFAVGVAGGHIDLDEAGEGRQRSIVGRVGLVGGFAIELELSRADLDQAGEARSAGGALEKLFRPGRRLAPYLAVGGGGGRIEQAGGGEARFGYGELGGGILLRGRRLALGLDWRAGVRRSESSAAALVDPGATALVRQPPAEEWERDRYHRGRLMLLVQF